MVWTPNAMKVGVGVEDPNLADGNLEYLKSEVEKIGTLANLTTDEKTNLVGAVNEANLSMGLVPYSVNGGGTGLTINKVSEDVISFTLSGIRITFPSGRTYWLTAINNFAGLSGTSNNSNPYNIIIEEDSLISNGNGTYTANATISDTVIEQLANGSGGADGYYNVNIGLRPLYPEKKVSGSWVHKEFIKIGMFTKTAGVISTPSVNEFNKDYGAKIREVVDHYQNGNNWYRKYSDGWIEQGGYVAVSQDTSVSVNFITQFASSVLNISWTLVRNLDTGATGAASVNTVTTSSFTLANGWPAGSAYWYACGF